MKVGTETARQAAHYAAVKRRLGMQSRGRNRLKEILADAERRSKQLLEKAERIRALREKHEAVLVEDVKDARRYRERMTRRANSKAQKLYRQKILATYKARIDDLSVPLLACPFTTDKSPCLRKGVAIILLHYRVTWLAVISSRKDPNTIAARAAVYNFLHKAGFSWWRIASVTEHDVDSYPHAAKRFALRHRASVQSSACFFKATNCLENINQTELEAWGVKPPQTEAKQEIDADDTEVKNVADEVHFGAGEAVFPEVVCPE